MEIPNAIVAHDAKAVNQELDKTSKDCAKFYGTAIQRKLPRVPLLAPTVLIIIIVYYCIKLYLASRAFYVIKFGNLPPGLCKCILIVVFV